MTKFAFEEGRKSRLWESRINPITEERIAFKRRKALYLCPGLPQQTGRGATAEWSTGKENNPNSTIACSRGDVARTKEEKGATDHKRAFV